MNETQVKAYKEILAVYEGNDGEATKALYARLGNHGPAGTVAINLFRAHKCSTRAKVYRGGVRGKGSYKSMAYDRKQWSMKNLCEALSDHAETLGIVWGWGVDVEQPTHPNVLYVELPTGQVSFHAGVRGEGPTYPGEWDGIRGKGPNRICRWIMEITTKAGVA